MTTTVWPVQPVAGTPTYTAKDHRQVMATALAGATAARPLGARSGVRVGTPPTTVQATSTQWTVNPHAGVLDLETSAAAGTYWYAVSQAEVGTITAASASGPRKDIVWVRIDDPAESDGSSAPAVVVGYTAGSVGSWPSPPATPARCMVLAEISVPISGGGSPSVVWVAPYAAPAGAIIPVRGQAERDAIVIATADYPVWVDRKDTGQLDRSVAPGSWLPATFGPWLPYSAVRSGFAVGSVGTPPPVAETIWRRESDMVRVRYRFVFGSDGSAPGASGVTFSLPLTPATTELYRVHVGSIVRAPTSHLALVRLEGSVARVTLGTSPLVNVTSTTPWGGAWANGDMIIGELVYRL